MEASVTGKNMELGTAPASYVALQSDSISNGAVERIAKKIGRDKRELINNHAKKWMAEKTNEDTRLKEIAKIFGKIVTNYRQRHCHTSGTVCVASPSRQSRNLRP